MKLKTTRLEQTIQKLIDRHLQLFESKPNTLHVAPNIQRILLNSKLYKDNTILGLTLKVEEQFSINSTSVTYNPKRDIKELNGTK